MTVGLVAGAILTAASAPFWLSFTAVGGLSYLATEAYNKNLGGTRDKVDSAFNKTKQGIGDFLSSRKDSDIVDSSANANSPEYLKNLKFTGTPRSYRKILMDRAVREHSQQTAAERKNKKKI